ncbi:DUF1450 domain-containing protein [Ammoniphilus sp. CFH 90114]|uniref:DUF1450 domain-containing protein n=1 Tax=Ammoniphilus sp. CFH 90114 TaxID=2493665 RepID=UPI001F0BE49B|nr:DUF1450 domain-containing protein [Ammoniphilus sp. CFH 90114]
MAKFCERNVHTTEAKEAIDILQEQYASVVEVRVVDCFRRCLQCRVRPFCRIQLETIEAEGANELVEKVLENIKG